MCRMPEKQTWRWTVLNCGWSCFHQVSYANHLSFPSNWNIPLFLWLFDLLDVLLYYFCESIILSCQFKLSKEKIRRNVAFSTTAIHIYFASLTLICKLLIWQIWLETKIWPFSLFFAFFQFLTCLPFGAPCFFCPSRFLKILFRLFIPTFWCRKVMRNAVTE